MKIMYIDESGDTLPAIDRGKNFFVLTGCVLDEIDLQSTEKSLRSIKSEFFQNPGIEIKSNFLRYANPALSEGSILKLRSKDRYDDLERKMSDFLKKLPAILFSVVICKKGYWEIYPSQNPYGTAYMFLLEKFQMYLERENAVGICIIDPREGRIEKHFLGNELDDIHTQMRWESNDTWTQCPRVVEKLLFSQSDKTVGIQIADLYCYPVFHVFEYNKKPSEYWRFNECTEPKIFKETEMSGDAGLMLYPDKTKKDLRFYS